VGDASGEEAASKQVPGLEEGVEESTETVYASTLTGLSVASHEPNPGRPLSATSHDGNAEQRGPRVNDEAGELLVVDGLEASGEDTSLSIDVFADDSGHDGSTHPAWEVLTPRTAAQLKAVETISVGPEHGNGESVLLSQENLDRARSVIAAYDQGTTDGFMAAEEVQVLIAALTAQPVHLIPGDHPEVLLLTNVSFDTMVEHLCTELDPAILDRCYRAINATSRDSEDNQQNKKLV